jgi:FAD/FMN-containing dehydrogenase
VLSRCHSRGLPPYLVVLKRHRPDAFLLSHGLDGWSLAMDFPIGASRRADLWRLTGELTDIVLDAGGRFYFAKDAVLRAEDVVRAIGADRLRQFGTIKSRLDPEGILTSNLWRRINPQGT